ncbi:MAG: MFS transporter [Colwellia sp.]|nr:MFS transporter [Colwellia sp.]
MFSLFDRNFLTFLTGATILSIPMPMLIILGGLAGAQLAPDASFATFPVSIQILAGLFVVAPMSLFMGRHGRKVGFLLAAISAICGGVLAALGLIQGSFLMLCAAHGLLGIAVVSFGLFRFAAAEFVDSKNQAKAISITLGIGLIAALLAPEVFRIFKDALAPIPLAGSYLALSGIAILGTLPILAAKFSLPKQPQPATKTAPTRRPSVLKRPKVLAAIICSLGSSAGMTLLMTPTAIAMVGCGFLDVQAGDVIRWHVVAMFAPSFFTGSLITRFGVERIVLLGGLIFAAAAAVALMGLGLTYFYVSLILLGIGWNFGFIGASAMLNAELSPAEKPLFQGLNDTVVALGATVASFSSGVLVSSFGWAVVAMVLFPFAIILMIGALYYGRQSKSQLEQAA